MDFYSLRIKGIKKETNDAVSITFDVPENLTSDFKYTAGQYLTLEATINNETIRRAYSIWKAPFENEISVLIKKIEGGSFSSYANLELKVGDAINVSNPIGGFKISSDNEKSTTFFAAGSGITPILSMVKQQLFDQSSNSATLFYVNKNSDSTIFMDNIDKLSSNFPNQLNVFHLFTREKSDKNEFSGRINEAKCAELLEAGALNINSDSFYICGPEEMILSTKDFLMEHSVEKQKINFELFTSNEPDEVDLESHLDEATVHITIDDDEFEFEYVLSASNSLLDAGNEAGLDLPFSCKGGVCCTCKAKIMEGSAMMIKNYALSDEEVAEGYILTCQSHPTSEKLVISYDE